MEMLVGVLGKKLKTVDLQTNFDKKAYPQKKIKYPQAKSGQNPFCTVDIVEN